MRCKECSYWLRDLSLPKSIGFCSAKVAVSSENDVCEIFKRKESESVAVKVHSYY